MLTKKVNTFEFTSLNTIVEDLKQRLSPLLSSEKELEKMMKFIDSQSSKDEMNAEFSNKMERLLFKINGVQNYTDREIERVSKRISILERGAQNIREDLLEMKEPSFMRGKTLGPKSTFEKNMGRRIDTPEDK